MQLHGARGLVIGASGALGAALSRGLHAEDMRLVLAGRNQKRLSQTSAEVGNAPTISIELTDAFEPGPIVEEAVERLGGLDLLLVTTGVAAFGAAEHTDEKTIEALLRINMVAPMRLGQAALPYLRGGGTLAVMSAILADHPTANMAAYSASKAAISAWLNAVRREQRRQHVTVFDIRPPHMDTGLVERALAGGPPTMPTPTDPATVVSQILEGLRRDARELFFDLSTRQLMLR